jgi:hypothetical protein
MSESCETYVDIMSWFRELFIVLTTYPILNLLDVAFLGNGIINGSAEGLWLLKLDSASTGSTRM